MSANRSDPSTSSAAAPPGPGELILTRTFDAPRALVWKARTDPNHLTRWWGPHGFTTPVCELDLQPGGALLLHMHGPDGTVYPMKGVVREVVEPERLVFSSVAQEDEEGNVQLELLTMVTLAECGGRTELTLRAVVVKATPEAAGQRAGMEEGWKQTLDKLAGYLART